jgi:hypothetical protein
MNRFFRPLISLIAMVLAIFTFTPAAWAFCGFYVAKADTKLYNQASQVVIARDGDRTVLTMANDFQGEVKDFAIVVPVPTAIKQEQVKVAPPQIIERLDAFSAPRLVEYFDPDPCAVVSENMPYAKSLPSGAANLDTAVRRDRSLGVKVEARFNVGEYDIVILSAKESGGLAIWLNQNGYKIPTGAKELLQPYIRSSMKFFVAKVNLDKFAESGHQFLRPLQISYQSNKFVLPIRLGMINAATEQDLIVYILSPHGQTEITNYRTVKVPSNVNIPIFVKEEFGDFYKSMFQTAYIREDQKVAFLEYAWNMSSCDPCSADPLNAEELKQAGVFWLDYPADSSSSPRLNPYSSINSTFITRLHVRYTRDKFPEDLMFQTTSAQESFQGRYVLQYPFKGEINCPAGRDYQQSLHRRLELEGQNLAHLTNWKIEDIRQKMNLHPQGYQGYQGYIQPSWWRRFLAWLISI